MKVGDIMTTDPVCVNENDLMTHARQVLRDNQLHGLPVLDEKGSVTGMLDDQDILRLKSNKSEVTVGGYAREFPLITPEMEVKDAVKMLLDSKQHRSPVVRSSTDRSIAGILSDKNVLRHVRLRDLSPKTAGEIMNTKVKTVYFDDSVAQVWGNMLEWDYSGMPVISYDGDVLGIITRSDIIKAGFARTGVLSSNSHDSVSVNATSVEKLMSTPLYSISAGTRISDAIKNIIQYDVGRICVTEEKRLLGMVDRFLLLEECLNMHAFD